MSDPTDVLGIIPPQVPAILATTKNEGTIRKLSGNATEYYAGDGTWGVPAGAGNGTVTTVSVTTANGVSGSVANPTSTPAITLTLGNITPVNVTASGTVTGTNLGNVSALNLNGNASTFLNGSGNFTEPSGGSGNVTGPGSSTNLALVTWSGTGGTALLDNANATLTGSTTQYLDRSGNFSTPAGTGGSGSIYPAFTAPVDGDYAWINQGSATTTVNANGGIYLNSPKATGPNLRVRKKAAPVTTPYTVTAAFFPFLVALNYQSCGILFRESSSGKMISIDSISSTSGGAGSRMAMNIARWSSATVFSANSLILESYLPSALIWYRIADNGTNLIYSYSTDGYNFIQIFSEARGSFFTGTGFPNEIGFYVDDETNTYPIGMTLLSWAQA